jgi:hypothetical protein
MVLVEDCEQQDLWLSISIFSATLRLFKTKVMCTIFISVDIFSLKYRPNSKNSVRNCLTKYRKNKMPALLM